MAIEEITTNYIADQAHSDYRFFNLIVNLSYGDFLF